MQLLNSETPDGLEIPAPRLFHNNNFMLTVALQSVLWSKGMMQWRIWGSLGQYGPSGKKNSPQEKIRKHGLASFV